MRLGSGISSQGGRHGQKNATAKRAVKVDGEKHHFVKGGAATRPWSLASHK